MKEPRDDIEAAGVSNSDKDGTQKPSTRKLSLLRQRNPKHGQLSSSQESVATQDVYLGSYSRSSTPTGLIAAPSPRASNFHLQLEPLLQAVDSDIETYGVEEARDGFFDASFLRPLERDYDELMQKALGTLPDSFHKNHPLSLGRFLPQQFREAKGFFRRITTSRAGIKLLKTFLGFSITYIICLIPASRNWLGRYNYIIVISAIINHPGRPIGSQVDGAFMTTLGTVAGLGWGSLALYVSTSTPAAQSGYGGILAAFLIIFAAVIGWLRCVLIRFYQAVLAAGFAIFYTCLANTSQNVGWIKVFDYGIPWVLGQAICLVVALIVFPDAGSRSIS
ncbi:hypothetical protein OEA41_001218 [Lepraria neglecta]|uniref:Putative ER transporter 6TM N-terminal domain-containing protein n=1 Tax=Lepraria neglecta TaxID=209136 RepID=A0AAE0DQ57_9LECA|nr:hypothetical protein OEA41_001218 [Lepraria neglecta]